MTGDHAPISLFIYDNIFSITILNWKWKTQFFSCCWRYKNITEQNQILLLENQGIFVPLFFLQSMPIFLFRIALKVIFLNWDVCVKLNIHH